MNKYIKLEDIEYILSSRKWRNVDDLKKLLADLPTIELDRCTAIYIKAMQNRIAELERDVRPQGEWIKNYKGQVNNICSNCQKEVGRKTPFCPNCGAEMKGADK